MLTSGRNSLCGNDGGTEILPRKDLAQFLAESLDVADWDIHGEKRLAFQLHMDGIPYKSTKSDSIEKALGVSEKTSLGVGKGSPGFPVIYTRCSRNEKNQIMRSVMSTNNTPKDERDEVLFAFHQTGQCPTAAEIIEWNCRYPQFADDIRAHAAVARDWARLKGTPAATPDEVMLARGHSRILNALYNAEVAAEAAVESRKSFQQIMSEQETMYRASPRKLELLEASSPT